MQTTRSLQNHIFCHLSRCTNARSTCKSSACTSGYTDTKHYHCSITTYSGNNRKITGGILSDPENKGERQQGVNFDTLGSWNNRINMPLAVEKSIKMGRIIPEIPLEQVGIATHTGRKLVNEDRYVVERLTPEILCFGIFDGHGGELAADYVSANIMHFIRHWLGRTEDLNGVLKRAYFDINNMLTRHMNFYCLGKTHYNIKVHVEHLGASLVIISESHAMNN